VFIRRLHLHEPAFADNTDARNKLVLRATGRKARRCFRESLNSFGVPSVSRPERASVTTEMTTDDNSSVGSARRRSALRTLFVRGAQPAGFDARPICLEKPACADDLPIVFEES
jgi:hypothetical protein